ncbi:hypothetical protein GCM10010967_42960 [Dyadobacter beijingensis]|uniref:Uncharacterized protein n=1 Tax=Dyadobacter beijingensis TaxID=365489 RepID=A0ABQ2IAX4_9BACT|nr:hypothetical protein [Dyadobacter beijingensis]GGN03594.1 hypothetical protein GCM10010967_42960 [Dyadobacter beijingensis]
MEETDIEHYEAFKANKVIPQVLEAEILRALSFYPSLVPVKIRFVFKQRIKGSVMQAQPLITTMFGTAREYRINISALFRLTHTAIPIRQVPSDILIGWIGHELGHIMDYEQRNLWGMLRFGAGYLFSSSFVKNAERVADTFAVNHGLGNYILKTKYFILDHAALPEKYKQKIARLYLSPDDIVAQVRALEAQGNPSGLARHE